MSVSVGKVKAVDRQSNTITYKIQLSALEWLAESLTELKSDAIFQYYDGEYPAHTHFWRSPVRIDTSRGGKRARKLIILVPDAVKSVHSCHCATLTGTFCS